MKKLTNFFPIVILCCLFVTAILWNDMKERTYYDEFSGYQQKFITISEDDAAITMDKIEAVFAAAKETNVVLMNEFFDKQENSNDYYFSVDSLTKLYKPYLSIEELTPETASSFVSTYYSKSDNQSGYYPDFLKNDRARFFKTDAMRENAAYPKGTYALFYQDSSDYQAFMEKAEKILATPKESLIDEAAGRLKEEMNLLKAAVLISLIFFTLFYFLLVIFQLYHKVKKIGCLRLLGFRFWDINKLLIKPLAIQLLSTSVILICGSVFLPNVQLGFIISLVLFLGGMGILTAIVFTGALLLVYKQTTIANAVKNESLIRKISNVCLVTQVLVSASVLIFSIALIPTLLESNQTIANLANSSELMDYSVFRRINDQNDESNNQMSYLEFFRSLESNQIPYAYADFANYLLTDKEDKEAVAAAEAAGDVYQVASVDRNYLKDYKLQVTDLNGKSIDLADKKQEVFLVPEAKKEIVGGLTKKLKERYKRLKLTDEAKIYLYKGQTFKTFDSQTGIPIVQSPTLRVIDEDYPYTAMDNSTGLNIAGGGMNTSLRFKIGEMQSNEFYQQKLSKLLEQAHLSQALAIDEFISYRGYYSAETTSLHKTMTIFISGISVGIIIYLILTIQTFLLYLAARTDEVAVKVLLGMRRKDIFRKTILLNIGTAFVPVIGVLAYTVFGGIENKLLIFATCAGFLIINSLLLFFITKLIRFKNVYQWMKGS
ncbi:hypothetical protein BAU15_01875 [Enterococcus sp. JM4C]|uniref:hypothetical protein n=1 Tax=Candidatus Enterococcus huntleyi TaxID=1857217 RepID=UPI0013794CA2|nr:hypothetical protein [Enterococcus sp. JM4C]KAF1299418.1 hypothetical protein BAU15_01875 [Enterococcus sp. JM4C]